MPRTRTCFSNDPPEDDRLNGVVASSAEAGRTSLKRLEETVDRLKRVTKLDRAELQAVLSNLVRNAAAAIAATEREGTICVFTSSSDEETVLEVTDDGIGIDEEALQHSFEPTFHVDSGRVGTTNWGLFTSRGIVTGHGGYIEIESTSEATARPRAFDCRGDVSSTLTTLPAGRRTARCGRPGSPAPG